MKRYFSYYLNVALFSALLMGAYGLRERIVQEMIHSVGHIEVAMLGDSHTEYGDFSFLLQRPVLRAARGYFTSWQIKRLLLKEALRLKPNYCFILCGTNDIATDPHYTRTGLLSNYRLMADSLRAHRIEPIFQTIPYQYQNPAFNREVDSVNAALGEYCQQQGFDLIDLNRITSQNHQLATTYKRIDGVHLNAAAYQVWASELRRYLAMR